MGGIQKKNEGNVIYTFYLLDMNRFFFSRILRKDYFVDDFYFRYQAHPLNTHETCMGGSWNV